MELKKEITEHIEESSKGLEKRQGEIRKAAEEALEKVCEVIIKEIHQMDQKFENTSGVEKGDHRYSPSQGGTRTRHKERD